MGHLASMGRRGAAALGAIALVGVPTASGALGRPDRPPIRNPILTPPPVAPAPTKPRPTPAPGATATPATPATPVKPPPPPPFFVPATRTAISRSTDDLARAVAVNRETSNLYAMSIALRDASDLVDAAGVNSAIGGRVVPVERSPFLSDTLLAPIVGLLVISLGIWRMAGRLPGRMGS